MIDAYFIPRKNRTNVEMVDIYVRLKPPIGGYLEISSKKKVKGNHYDKTNGCKITGRMTQEDKDNNLLLKKYLGQLKKNCISAWDKLKDLGQEEITSKDIQRYLAGDHERALNRNKRLTFREAADIWLEYMEPKMENLAPYKSGVNSTIKILDAIGRKDITIDNYSEVVAGEIADYMLNTDYVYRNHKKRYAYKSRMAIRGVNKQIFDYFYKHKNRLKVVPLLPNQHPWTYVKIEKTKVEKKKIDLRETLFFTNDEVEVIEKAELSPRLDFFRKCYLFQIYTGISFADLGRFTDDHLIDYGDDGIWLDFRRKKTSIAFHVELNKKAQDLIEYFRTAPSVTKQYVSKGIVKVGCMSSYWYAMEQVGARLGVEIQEMTRTHKPRHTFAMRMLNEELCSMQDLASMLGHKTTATTEKHYAVATLDRSIRKKRIREGRHLVVTKSQMTGTH